MSQSQRQRRLACNFSRQPFPISSVSTGMSGADDNGLQFPKSKLPDSVSSQNSKPDASSEPVTFTETVNENFPCRSSTVECIDADVAGQSRNSRMNQAGASASNHSMGWATWRTNNAPSLYKMEFDKEDLLDDLVGPLQPPCLPKGNLSENNHLKHDVSSEDRMDKNVNTVKADMTLLNFEATQCSHISEPAVVDSVDSISKKDISSMLMRSPKRSYDVSDSNIDISPQRTDIFATSANDSGATIPHMTPLSTDIGATETENFLMNKQAADYTNTYRLFGSGDFYKDVKSAMTSSTLSNHDLMSSSSADSFFGSNSSTSQSCFREVPSKYQDEVKHVLADSKDVWKHLPNQSGDTCQKVSNQHKNSDTAAQEGSLEEQMNRLWLQGKHHQKDQSHLPTKLVHPPLHENFDTREIITQTMDTGCVRKNSSYSSTGNDNPSPLKSDVRSDSNIPSSATFSPPLAAEPLHLSNEPTSDGELLLDGTAEACAVSLKLDLTASLSSTAFAEIRAREDFTALSEVTTDITQDGISEDLMSFTSLPPLEDIEKLNTLPRSDSTASDASLWSANTSITEGNVPFEQYLSPFDLEPPQMLGKSDSFGGQKPAIPIEAEQELHLGPSSVVDLPDDHSAEFLSTRQRFSLDKSDSSDGHKPTIPIEDKQEILSLLGSLTKGGGVVAKVKESSLVLRNGDDTVLEAVQNTGELALKKPSIRSFGGRGNDVAIAVSNSSDVQAVGTFQYNKQTIKVSANETAKNIKSQVRRELSESKRLFVRTGAYEAVSSVLETEQMVFIIGPSGVGKRMIALGLLREYEENGFEPLILRTVEEMRQRINTDTKQAVLMRNIFGIFEFEQQKFDDWIDFFETIEVCADKMKKFIFTSKEHIFDRGTPCLSMTRIFKKELVVDLQKLEVWNSMEKRTILFHHLKEQNINLDDDLIEKIAECSTSCIFPKCCQMFAKNPDLHNPSCAVKFFQRPVFYYRGIIASMFQRDDKKQFMVLLLTMIFGQLHDSLLQDLDRPDAEKAQKYLTLLGYGDSSSRLAFRSVAEGMLGTYLRRSEDAFVFTVECLYDAVACVFGSKYPRYLLEVCSVDYLCEKVHMDKDQAANCGDDGIFLEEDQFDFLSQRLVQELRNGNTSFVSLHIAFAHAPFIPYFVKYCEKQDDFNQIIQSKDKLHSDSFLYWSSWNQREHLFKWIFHECKKQKIGISSKEMLKIVKACCVSGNVEVLNIVFRVVKKVSEMVSNFETTCLPLPSCKSLCSQMTETGTGTVQVNGLLHTACFHGYLTLVELLVSRFKSAVDRPDTYGFYPVNIAARQGHVEIVKFLIQNGVKINHVKAKKHVMHDACETGQTEVVKVLLEECPKLLDVKEEPFLRYPIHLATMSKEAKLVEILLQKGAKPDVWDSAQNTAFHTACMRIGNLRTLKALNPSSDQVNMGNKRKKTCLHLACEFGGTPMVGFLISRGADVNAVDYMGQTPLHVACKKNKRSIVEKLLSGKLVDLFVLDIQGKSALHLTRNKNIQKLLKDNMTRNSKDIED